MESLAHLHKFTLYIKPFPKKSNSFFHSSIFDFHTLTILQWHTRSITTRRLFTFLSSNKKKTSFFQRIYLLGLFSHISDRLFNSMSILDYECITHIFRVYILPSLLFTMCMVQHFEWRKMTRNNLWQGQVFCVSLHKPCCSHGVLSLCKLYTGVSRCIADCSHFVYIVNGNRLMRFSGSNEKLFALVSLFFSLSNTN